MPNYCFVCHGCGDRREIFQKHSEIHEMTCVSCGAKMNRDYAEEAPQVKLNRGFFSLVLGKEVGSQTDYNKNLEEWYFKTGQNKDLGNNKTPKDQWIEEKYRKNKDSWDKSNAVDEALMSGGYYEKVKTYVPKT